MAILKSKKEIEHVIGNCIEQMEDGSSRYPGISYEEGIEQALRWVLGEDDDEEWPFDK